MECLPTVCQLIIWLLAVALCGGLFRFLLELILRVLDLSMESAPVSPAEYWPFELESRPLPPGDDGTERRPPWDKTVSYW